MGKVHQLFFFTRKDIKIDNRQVLYGVREKPFNGEFILLN